MPYPPEDVTGVNALAAVPCVSVVVATDVAAVSAAGLTARSKVAVSVCAVGVVLSVTVTVKLVLDSKADGVPLIWPVVVSKLNPVGRDGLTA